MTIVVKDRDAVFARHVTVAREQHKRLLRKFNLVSNHVADIVALMWLPGRNQTFDNPVRSVLERDRPLLLTLEVGQYGDLRFCGAISRFREDELVFKPVFSYDATLPLSYHNSGPALSGKNLSLARRLNEMLRALIDFGRSFSRPAGQSSAVTQPTWPDVICDKYGKVFEDYRPALGFGVPNPAKKVTHVSVVNQVGQEVKIPLATALRDYPQVAFERLRAHISPKFLRAVSDQDLLHAAQNPQADLNISRWSKIQICPVAAVQDLPVGYAGTVLAPVDWAPPARDIFGE